MHATHLEIIKTVIMLVCGKALHSHFLTGIHESAGQVPAPDIRSLLYFDPCPQPMLFSDLLVYYLQNKCK